MSACLVCASPDLNLIDGSSVWAQMLALVLAETGSLDVHFLSKTAPERDILFNPLLAHPRIHVIDGTGYVLRRRQRPHRLNDAQMVEAACRLDQQHHYRLVIVRGLDIAKRYLDHPDLLARAWLYLTDIPQKLELLSRHDRGILEQLARGARRILCQSSGFRRLWDQIAPGINDDQYSLYTPVVPDPPEKLIPLDERPRVAIYAGKFKPAWKTLEMVGLWPTIHSRIPAARLVMIGDKFHRDRSIPDYPRQMRYALGHTPNVEWLGGLPRDEVQRHMESAALGLSWRDIEMDQALEYSTKILEYGRGGCPAILNRNLIHEKLLGQDYPLFANSESEFCERVVSGLSDHDLAAEAAQRLLNVAVRHTFSQRVNLIREWLKSDLDPPTTSPVTADAPIPAVSTRSIHGNGKLRVLVAGHDIKFFQALRGKLESTGRYEFIYDIWADHAMHDESQSRRLIKSADIIFCEWCLGNIAWYSQHKRPGQRLLARFHRQEMDKPYFQQSQFEQIDHVVFVSDHIRREVLARVPFPQNRTSVISNLMDPGRFKPVKKAGDSNFTLGMIGIIPSMKRLDRALDTLELLLDKDPRYKLRVKGNLPFNYGWLVNREYEVAYYTKMFARINSSRLRYSVIFDPPDKRVPEWLSLVGFILSPSDFESFHLAVGEGMLTGSIPVVWDWNGARELWPDDSIVCSSQDAAERIENTRNSDGFQKRSMEARAFVLSQFPIDEIMRQWNCIIQG